MRGKWARLLAIAVCMALLAPAASQCRVVCPLLSVALTSAPARSRSSTIGPHPTCTALCRRLYVQPATAGSMKYWLARSLLLVKRS